MPLPDGWLKYSAFGDVVKGTKILPMKVPLKESMVWCLWSEQKFTVAKLLNEFPRLKCVVDLTSTSRYYNPMELTSAGISYVKLQIPGHKIPSSDLVEQFFKIMENFASNSGEDEIVAVHCTHGINRTGYLICRYLVQQLNWDIEDSLKAFREARGYSIERANYVKDLKKRPWQ